MKKIVRIDLLSHAHHLNQPLTGFHLWTQKHNYQLIIRDCSQNEEYAYKKTAFIANINDYRLVYDMADGYQSPNATEYLLDHCDAYFKRSYSEIINKQMGYRDIYPYGLNYNITWIGNPLLWRRKGGVFHAVNDLLRGNMITSRQLVKKPDYDKKKPVHILFFARLWPTETALSNQENEERYAINIKRINLLRTLKRQFGDTFMGGLSDNLLTRKMAPDLIMSSRLTRRDLYIKRMRCSDICIATTGLHGSIGGKMGEYVACSKAIISEPLKYNVPGGFIPEQNYLEFNDEEQCIVQVNRLLNHPETIITMQMKNHEYYEHYLRPECLIQNTLNSIGIGGEA